MTDNFTGTQIGADGRRYASEDVGDVPIPAPYSNSWRGTFLPMRERMWTSTGSTDDTVRYTKPINIGSRGTARLNTTIKTLSGGQFPIYTVTVTATGGTFYFPFDDTQSADIPYNASPQVVQAAIRAVVRQNGALQKANDHMIVTGTPGHYTLTWDTDQWYIDSYTDNISKMIFPDNDNYGVFGADDLTGPGASLLSERTMSSAKPGISVYLEHSPNPDDDPDTTMFTGVGNGGSIGSFEGQSILGDNPPLVRHEVRSGLDEWVRFSYRIYPDNAAATFSVNGEFI